MERSAWRDCAAFLGCTSSSIRRWVCYPSWAQANRNRFKDALTVFECSLMSCSLLKHLDYAHWGKIDRSSLHKVAGLLSPHTRPLMDWALHQQQVRFDIRPERAEYEYLFKHSARVLQDRLARLGGGDRTKEIPIAEWERVYRNEAQVRILLHQARVLDWGKEKGYYYANKLSSGHL
jgi:hypothetical protein